MPIYADVKPPDQPVFVGGRYEKQVSRLLPRFARSRLQLRDATVTHTDWRPGSLILDIVANSDEITDAEAAALVRVAPTLAGQDADGNTVHAVAEISVTLEPRDVIRSAMLAAILHKAIGQPVHAVAIGSEVAGDAAVTAENYGVVIITVPEQPD